MHDCIRSDSQALICVCLLYFSVAVCNLSQPVAKMDLLVCIALASVALLAQPAAAQFSYPARVQQADSCPSSEQREATRADINRDLDALLQDIVIPPLMPCGGDKLLMSTQPKVVFVPEDGFCGQTLVLQKQCADQI